MDSSGPRRGLLEEFGTSIELRGERGIYHLSSERKGIKVSFHKMTNDKFPDPVSTLRFGIWYWAEWSVSATRCHQSRNPRR